MELMPTAMVAQPGDARAANIYLVSGATLLVLAVGLATYGIAATPSGLMFALGNVFGILLIFGGVTWAFVRKKSERIRARAFLLISILCALSSVGQLADRYKREEELAELMGRFKLVLQRANDEMLPIEQRVRQGFENAARIDTATLVDPVRRKRAISDLEDFSRALDEREAFARHLDSNVLALTTGEPNEAKKVFERKHRESMARALPGAQELYKIAREYIVSMRKLLDWASTQTGVSANSGGMLVTRSATTAREYQALVLDVRAASDKAIAGWAAAEERGRAVRSQIDDFLAGKPTK